jgi:hypothetical protein
MTAGRQACHKQHDRDIVEAARVALFDAIRAAIDSEQRRASAKQ